MQENDFQSKSDQLKVEEILEEMKGIKKELIILNSHKLIDVYNSLSRFLYFSFLRGVVTGFGYAMGATVVVWLFINILSTFELVPIIGDYVRAIIEQVNFDKRSLEN